MMLNTFRNDNMIMRKSKLEKGNAYVEYFVIASVVLLATLAFYNFHLRPQNWRGAFGGGEAVGGAVEGTFNTLCAAVAGAPCGPAISF